MNLTMQALPRQYPGAKVTEIRVTILDPSADIDAEVFRVLDEKLAHVVDTAKPCSIEDLL